MRVQAMILFKSFFWLSGDRVTYDATRFIDYEKTSFAVVQCDLDRRSGDRRFVSMDDVP